MSENTPDKASSLIKCPSCSKDVSREAPTCPNCGAVIKKKVGCLKIIAICFGAFFGLCVLAGIIGGRSSKSGNSSSSSGSGGSAIVLPAEQEQLSTVIKPFIEQYRSAPNELKKSALRTDRAKALSDALKSMEFDGWVGTVERMSTTTQGKAHLEIKLHKSPVSLKNWNNELSDIRGNTLIPQGSDLFRAVSELAKGDRVKVSGRFLQADKDYIMEGSPTERGAMTEPEFIVLFSKAVKY